MRYSSACTVTPSYSYGPQAWEEITDSANYTSLSAQDLTVAPWLTVENVANKKLSGMAYGKGRSFLVKVRHNTAGESFEILPSAVSFNKLDGLFA